MKVTAGEIAPCTTERWSLKGPLGQAMVLNCSEMWLVLKDFGDSTWIQAAMGKKESELSEEGTHLEVDRLMGGGGDK